MLPTQRHERSSRSQENNLDLLANEKFALELTLLQPRLAAWGQSCKSIRNRQGFVQGPIFRNRYAALPKVNE